VTGNYKTQYYLTLTTNPPGVDSPLGAGWYDTGTNATVSADAFVDNGPGSQYRFNGWTTANMTEIADPTRSPTQVIMDEGKTMTANYVVQYWITFNQTGVNPDFTKTVLTIDDQNYTVALLAKSFWWDKNSTHTFTFQSPLVVTENTKRYVWTSTIGISTLRTGSIPISGSGNITGNYKTQYLLTVITDPSGLSPQPARSPAGEEGPANGWWYDAPTSVTLTAQPIPGYTFNHWNVDGASNGTGINPITLNINPFHTATAYYTFSAPALSVSISPPSAIIHVGESVPFTSTVSGGVPPYSYQWYLDGHPYPSATFSTWTFTPTATGIYNVYLRVTDSHSSTAQSAVSPVTVISTSPVGGFTVSMAKQLPASQFAAYAMLVTLFAAVLDVIRRRKK
jgi:hypothetical protein